MKKRAYAALLIFCMLWLGTASAFAETPTWVQETDREFSPAGGVVNYISPDGTISAEVGEGITWLREESGGSSTWYGIDNRSGEFKPGSRFWVRWISEGEDREEFTKYFNMLDDRTKKQIGQDHMRIFLFGVTDPDGNEYHSFSESVPLYIQLGDDFDMEDAVAMFMSDGMDESIEISFDETLSPEGRERFAVIELKHTGTALLGEGSSRFPASIFSEGNGHVLLVILAMLLVITGVLLRYRAEKQKEKEKNACDIVVMKRRYGEDDE